jgi:fatty-acyl-CoA synthase
LKQQGLKMAVKHYDWTAHHADMRPEKIAIKDLDTGAALTYAELDQRADWLAGWMQAQGMVKGDRVAILMPNCAEFFEIQFACSKAGLICLPLNWRLTEKELEYILKDSSPALLVHDENYATMVGSLVKSCSIKHTLDVGTNNRTTQYEQAMNAALPVVPVVSTHADISMIMYTSGTTGHPKGALITHGMTFYNCVNLGTPAAISAKTVQLVGLPVVQTGGLNCYANPILHAGGQILLMRDFEPGRALQVIGDVALGVTD